VSGRNPGRNQALLQPDSLSLFEAPLSGANEVPAVPTTATGKTFMVFDSETSQLHYRITVDDIEGITMAHIHEGAAGVNGGVVFTLFPNGGSSFSPSEPISGTLTLNETQVGALMGGNYYVNVHTTAYPAGEVRGQIAPYSPGAFHTSLTGQEETPPVTTSATGSAVFNINMAANTLDYQVYVRDIISITAAHLHPGWPGESGPAEITLYSPSDPHSFDSDNPLMGTLPFEDPQQVLNLISGYYYLNIHTQTYPAGEIRGQVNTAWTVYMPLLRR
jgi:hypothetical protein